MLYDKLYQDITEAVIEGEVTLVQANRLIGHINSRDILPEINEIESTREVTIRGTITFEYEANMTISMEPREEEDGDQSIAVLFEHQMQDTLAAGDNSMSISDIRVTEARVVE